MRIQTRTVQDVVVCPEAVEGLTGRDFYGDNINFTSEDLEHLKNCILDAQVTSEAIAMPGVEHVYAKLHLIVHHDLPKVED